MRIRRNGTPIVRVLARTELSEDGDCWLFKGPINATGYGTVCAHKRTVYVHRVVWESFNGPIPGDMVIMHLCDVPNCVNLAHLRMGTRSDNIRDCVRKGRHRHGNVAQTYCKRGGHLLAETAQITKHGRACRLCINERARIRYRQKVSKT